MKTARRPTVPIGALLSLLLLCGCAGGTPSGGIATETPTTPAGAPTATAEVSATETPPPGPTASPTTAMGPTATPSPASGQALVLETLHMVTAREGWATGAIAPNDGGLPPFGAQGVYRTSDGGVHWSDVSPEDMAPDSFATAYFLDLSHAWIAVSPPPSDGSGPTPTNFTVYRTQNGGGSWDQSEPVAISAGGPGMFSFPDPQHGWIMVSLGVAMSHEAVAIFRTTDGGMHWERVSLTSGMQGESTAGSLPFVCDKTGIAFSNTSTGWAAGACPGAQLFFFVSQDGGSTWEAVMPPPPAAYTADLFSQCQCVVNRPIFVSPEVGFVSIQIYEAEVGTALYVTEDGGVTWTPRALPTPRVAAGGPEIVDATTGWLTDGQQVYLTQDAGISWSAVGPLPFSGQDLRGVDFVDASYGWLQGTQLYVTDDGGHNWATISPILSTP